MCADGTLCLLDISSKGEEGLWGQLRMFLRNYFSRPHPHLRGIAVCDTIRLRVLSKKSSLSKDSPFAAPPSRSPEYDMTHYPFVYCTVCHESVPGRDWPRALRRLTKPRCFAIHPHPLAPPPNRLTDGRRPNVRSVSFHIFPGAGGNATDYNNYHTSRAAGLRGVCTLLRAPPRGPCPHDQKRILCLLQAHSATAPIGLRVCALFVSFCLFPFFFFCLARTHVSCPPLTGWHEL
ncbi:hypothetical protein BJV78DRAFT_22658 [Lactifluus subvellereus]|nr:hypothetical protein BJV78DRAFT_22658 [Lactifluus subvellereus]